MRNAIVALSLVLFTILAVLLDPTFANNTPESRTLRQDEESDPKEAEEEPDRASGFTFAQERKILAHFHATRSEFLEEGRLRLFYRFWDEDEALLLDFLPKIETTKNRIRWAQRNTNGLMLAETGTFLHSAYWRADVKSEMKATCFSQLAKRSFFALGFFDGAKAKEMVGSNLGKQCVKLKGMKFKDAVPRKPMPTARVEERLNFGFELTLGVLKSLRSSHSVVDTLKHPKFAQKFETGRVGIRWNGRVQASIQEFVIEGRLDKKWVEKNIF